MFAAVLAGITGPKQTDDAAFFISGCASWEFPRGLTCESTVTVQHQQTLVLKGRLPAWQVAALRYPWGGLSLFRGLGLMKWTFVWAVPGYGQTAQALNDVRAPEGSYSAPFA